MLFRRREKLSFGARMRALLWPKRSHLRSLRYLKKRVLRLKATPHAIAAGFAAGIFASFTPLIGFHFLIAFAIAYLLAGNMAASVLGCAVGGNPLTYPPIWAATYEVGRRVLRSEPIDGAAPMGLGHALHHMDMGSLWEPFLKPMLVGSVPLGLVVSLACYGLVYLAARGFQRRRAAALLARAEVRARQLRPAAEPAAGTPA